MGSSRIRAAAAVCALVLVTAACGGTEESAAPPAPLELSVTDYEHKLADLAEAIRPLAGQLNPATTLKQVNEIRAQLSTTLNAQLGTFDDLLPPKTAADVHRSLVDHLLSTTMDLRDPVAATGTTTCGQPFPEALWLHKAKVVTRESLDGAARGVGPEDFSAGGVQFDGIPVPPEPVQPKLSTRRPANGKVLKPGPGGSNTLTIANQESELDVLVSAVDGQDPTRPLASIFVHAGGTAALTGLPRAFHLHYKFGVDFDTQSRAFTRDCANRKYADPLDGPGHWSVALTDATGETPVFRVLPSGAGDYTSTRAVELAP